LKTWEQPVVNDLMKLDSLLSTSHRKDSFLIPKEMMITGIIQTDSPGQIAGIINGDVLTKSRVIILKEGIINGDVTADELLVYGKINGHVKSCNKIIVQSGAVIKGNINTAEIHMEKNATVDGIITKSGVQTLMKDNKTTKKKYLPAEKIEPVPAAKDQNTDRQAWF
jgi:cytoskeletal protein CcmA (bactofilin family)